MPLVWPAFLARYRESAPGIAWFDSTVGREGKHMGMVEMKEKILEFIEKNPGAKGGQICSMLGKRACDRFVDKCLQQLRRGNAIVFRKGWFLTTGASDGN